jgi:restriction system protein
MSYRRRSKDIATPIAQLAALGVLGVMFVPQFRFPALVIALIVVGVLSGLFLYKWNSRRGIERYVFENRLNFRASAASDAPCSPNSYHPARDDIVARIRSIDWFQFEKVIAAIYKELGFTVTRRGGANADGGIDLILNKGANQTAVQCKQWRTWKVRERTVREFLGALTHAKIPNGIIVTLCGYTKEAQGLANAHAIEIVTETGLSKLLLAANAVNNAEILAALNDKRKFCPKCESEMRLITARKGGDAGSQFWGCSTYPKCRYTMPFTSDHGQAGEIPDARCWSRRTVVHD